MLQHLTRPRHISTFRYGKATMWPIIPQTVTILQIDLSLSTCFVGRRPRPFTSLHRTQNELNFDKATP